MNYKEELIDRIIVEWSYKCNDGTPDLNDPEKLRILKTILKENETDIHSLGLHDRIPINEEPKLNKAAQFEKFCYSKYVESGQRVDGLQAFYNQLSKTRKGKQILKLVIDGGNRKLKSGKSTISGLDYDFYKECMNYVRPNNGHPSEFWFSVMFKGKVKGSVVGSTGIVSDVDVKSQGVSLKAYNDLKTVDLGTLDNETSKRFNEILYVYQVLTDLEINPSKTRTSLNVVLQYFDTKENIDDIKEFLKLSTTSKIKVINKLGIRIKNILGSTNDVSKLVQVFCDAVDIMIDKKIGSVSWWGIIDKSTDLYLEKSSELAAKLKCSDNKLSPNIESFKGGRLFIGLKRVFKDMV